MSLDVPQMQWLSVRRFVKVLNMTTPKRARSYAEVAQSLAAIGDRHRPGVGLARGRRRPHRSRQRHRNHLAPSGFHSPREERHPDHHLPPSAFGHRGTEDELPT